MSQIDGWLLIKGFEGLAAFEGDIDLICDPSALASVQEYTNAFFRSHASDGDVMVTCNGLIGTTLNLMEFSALGFDHSMMEVDISLWYPFAGRPLMRFDSLLSLAERTDQGWLAPSERLDYLFDLLFKGRLPTSASHVQPELAALVGQISSSLLLRGFTRIGRAPVAMRTIWHPSLIAERVVSRRHLRACPVSPLLGRESRSVRLPEQLFADRHTVFVKGS
jgi:hypothetical protein